MAWDVTDDPVDFDEAIAWFRKRVSISKADFESLSAEAKRKAFTVANVAQLDIVRQAWEAVDKVLKDGTSLEDFKKDIGPKLRAAWQGSVDEPAWRLETIFRNNLQLAYSAGRYRQAKHPDVASDRPVWMFDAILDGRETKFCRECDGTKLPSDDPWWNTRIPPGHFNAITRDTPIVTSAGSIQVGDLRPGTAVLTHTGLWKKVTAVLHKVVKDRKIRVLHLSSGRTLRITDEHPVLVNDSLRGLQWRNVGDLEIGDSLFEYVNEMPGVGHVAAPDPKNAPALVHEPSITDSVMGGLVGTGVPFPVDLNGDHFRNERDVQDVAAKGILSSRTTAEETEEVLFSWGEFGPQVCSKRADGSFAGLCIEHGVIHPHSLGNGRPSEAIGPVPLPRSLGHDIREPVRYRDLLELGPDSDAVPATPCREHGFAYSKRALDVTNAAPFAEVLRGNKGDDFVLLSKVNWHTSTIITIVDERYSGELCDLSVETDESYVANGIIVHNCRSTVITLTENEAGKLTAKPPTVNAQDGFGLPPGEDEWEPDLSKYPPPLAKPLESKLAKAPPPPPPRKLVEGKQFATLEVAKGIAKQKVDDLLGSIAEPEVLAWLEREPIQRLRFAASVEYKGQPSDGLYWPGKALLEVAVVLEPTSFGAQWKPGETWSVATAEPTMERAVRAVLRHELGHHAHMLGGRDTDIDDTVQAAFKRAVKSGVFITRYAKTNENEYFAESFTAYYLRRNDLRTHDPNGYKMVEDVLKKRGVLP